MWEKIVNSFSRKRTERVAGHTGRPGLVDLVDIEFVERLRNQGKSWRVIASLHPPVEIASGRWVRPSTTSIRGAYARSKTDR